MPPAEVVRSPKDFCPRPFTATSHQRDEAKACCSSSLHHDAKVSRKSHHEHSSLICLLQPCTEGRVCHRVTPESALEFGDLGWLTYFGLCGWIPARGPALLPSLLLLECLELSWLGWSWERKGPEPPWRQRLTWKAVRESS